MKSFRAKDGSGASPAPGRNGERNFKNETRSYETHASTSEPEARLYRKGAGRESRLCFMGHALMENRNGLVVDAALTLASGTAEREATLSLLDRRARRGRVTLGADKAYDVEAQDVEAQDVEALVGDLRARGVTPDVAINGASRCGKPRPRNRPSKSNSVSQAISLRVSSSGKSSTRMTTPSHKARKPAGKAAKAASARVSISASVGAVRAASWFMAGV